MFIAILIAILIGASAGVATGLTPGIHVNLVSLILVSMSGYFLGFTNPITLGVFIISMSVTHSFLDSIPSVFLGAPDSDMALAALPGHKLLLKGMGFEAVKLTIIGSLSCLLLTVSIIPLLIPFVPFMYDIISPYMGWILIAVVIFMILKEPNLHKKIWGLIVFFLSGILGIIVLNTPNIDQPLFPLLSGLFGVSILLMSLNSISKIPEQKITEKIKVPKSSTLKAIFAATFCGSITGMLPGLGSAQAAIIAMQFTRKIGNYGFMILIGGINTVNFVFSLATFYTLEKARNGAIVAVMDILGTIGLKELAIFLASALIAGGIATLLALRITRVFAKLITKVNYKALCIGVISFIAMLVLFFSSWIGFLILVVSTSIGIIPNIVGVKRSLAMGCLLLPVILFFML